jgi:hypothetical protein
VTKFLQAINGLPTMVTPTPYDQSIYYSSGLAANTAITLPSSGSFSSATAADVVVILNDRVIEFSPNSIDRDFILVGSGPYTQIKILYALANDSILRFRKYF